VTTYEQGRQEFETGRWSKAYRLFRQALKDEQTAVRDRHTARLLMARCLTQLGDPDQAETELNQAKPELPRGDQQLLEQFTIAWQEVEDTRRLTKLEVENGPTSVSTGQRTNESKVLPTGSTSTTITATTPPSVAHPSAVQSTWLDNTPRPSSQ
jgi:hypothetical protein